MGRTVSNNIYLSLVVLYALLTVLYVFLPFPNILPVSTSQLPAPKPVIALVSALGVFVIYGALGFLGLLLSRKLGFTDVWDKKITNKQRFGLPVIIGAGCGVFFIVADSIVSRFSNFGPLPHPPFPTSLVASATAAIGEEIIFRLFFISFWTWLISYILFRKKHLNTIFWIVSVFSAIAFALGHIPSIMILKGFSSPVQIPMIVIGEMLLLNGIVSFFAAYYFKKLGLLAAVGIHFWTDIVWHVVFGLF